MDVVAWFGGRHRRDGGGMPIETAHRLAEKRRGEKPYTDRRLYVDVHLHADKAVFVVRDEGPGFDVTSLPDPTDPENLLKPSGRGLLLIRTFMDEAIHNAAGNQLTMMLRRDSAQHSA